MNENKNGQAVQSKPADQPTKGNNGTVLNPKNEVMTPEKTKAPIENKKDEQVEEDDEEQEEKGHSVEHKTPVTEQKKGMPVSFDRH